MRRRGFLQLLASVPLAAVVPCAAVAPSAPLLPALPALSDLEREILALRAWHERQLMHALYPPMIIDDAGVYRVHEEILDRPGGRIVEYCWSRSRGSCSCAGNDCSAVLVR